MFILLSVFMTLPVLLLAATPSGAPNAIAFAESAAIVCVLGVLGLLLTYREPRELKPRYMFVLTVSSWFVIALLSALPFYLSDNDISAADAFFEGTSGITTTGATVFTGLDTMDKDLLLWRSILQWLGGIGIIGMFVAVLPFLRVGGMRLFATESSEWTEKALPRMKTLSRGLLLVYLVFSVVAVVTYWLSGMSLFDAFNHGLTSIATGGFSTSDLSMGKFSDLILLEATFFMIIGSLPFFLFVREMHGQHGVLFRDQQVRLFLGILFAVPAMLTLYRWWVSPVPFDPIHNYAATLFNVTSVVTTTGYASEDYSAWGPLAFVVFFFLMFVGGCSGSTAGGMKIFRFQLSLIILREQLMRLLHPRAVFTRNYNGRAVSDEIISSMIAYTFIFLLCLLVITVLLASLQLDFVTALSGALTSLTNVGPGLGDIIGPAGNFSPLPDAAKWILSVGMLMGRLEILSVVIVLSPGFWRG
ncbi:MULTISPECIES: TrkH family potassium uptake protein [Marinobacter]|jgi:trk system potassium uptake protein TrkH|uniref:Trk system potassium uptake protein n=2 Tax=Marinobacter nauticus TaxID=2743 RepID=A1U0J4_MARN8|nr:MULTISPECIES: TrkH family potassium uptake protein [Marinobacter]MCG8522630.1 TrkH family potassium uptake protein [Pseudomonadales bacterium]ABM18513.1 cation transporter [Marinobacter nauticus VT8]ERS12095.1 potassium transporter TrkH [Marinobacter sp. EN3]ERS81685.1 potassium transporter TrkH [Marinobacter sp. EVN1]MBN8238255.1 TrkH family potassium uptake protein [Marinobacter nauticus]